MNSRFAMETPVSRGVFDRIASCGEISGATRLEAIFRNVMKKPRSKILRRSRIPPPMPCKKAPKISAACVSDASVQTRLGSSMEFLNSVKSRFTPNPQIYVEFLRTIAGYSRGADTWKLCIKMVDLLFGHADLIYGFVEFFDGKLREEVQRNCRFAIDDVMDEREVMRCRLERCIECAEEALRLAPSDQVQFVRDELLEGLNLSVIKKLYGDRSVEMIEFLMKNPERALPVILEGLKVEDRAVWVIRSDNLRFLGQFRVLISKRGVKRKLRPD